MLQPVAVPNKHLNDYASIVGRPLADEIRERAEGLKGKRVLHVSATSFGGGVSEILYTLVPLLIDVGLATEWHVIYGREEFFNAT
ncbi:MAG: glycosyl transferase family 1, partial [Solirubrobacteraceae bacterium]